MTNMEEICLARIHLKTDCDFRDKLIDFCLNGKKQYVALGWSYLHDRNTFHDYESFFLR